MAPADKWPIGSLGFPQIWTRTMLQKLVRQFFVFVQLVSFGGSGTPMCFIKKTFDTKLAKQSNCEKTNEIIHEQCGSHTWYLSADFQINLVVYFLIVLYIRNYTLALRCNLVALVVASVGPTVINWYYNAPLVHIIEPDME